MALLTIQPLIEKSSLQICGNALDPADVAGDTVEENSDMFISIQNEDAAVLSALIAAPVSDVDCGAFGSQPLEDISVFVNTGHCKVVAIPRGYAVDGIFNITYPSGVDNLTVGAFKLA
jgi:hypothetical protein